QSRSSSRLSEGLLIPAVAPQSNKEKNNDEKIVLARDDVGGFSLRRRSAHLTAYHARPGENTGRYFSRNEKRYLWSWLLQESSRRAGVGQATGICQLWNHISSTARV